MMSDDDDMDSIEAQELLEMEIDRLRAENERLREFVTRPNDVAMMFEKWWVGMYDLWATRTGFDSYHADDVKALCKEGWDAGQAQLRAENERLRQALRFYAHRCHLTLGDPHAWDVVSGEPPNYLCDEAGTATIEDGTIAQMALRGVDLGDEIEEFRTPIEGEPNAKHERTPE